MSDVSLTMFTTGALGCRYHDVYLNERIDSPYEIPVPWYLVRHPRGNVVIDGGIPVEAVRDPAGRWGDVAKIFQPRASVEDTCLTQLAAQGIEAESVKTVLLSHLHLDHTGAIGRFPQATHIVQRAAMDYALSPDWFCAGAFVRADFDRPALRWRFLEDAWGDFFDLYGDGSIICIRSPGHTVGHQSFLIRTARGRVLLAIDAADTLDHWEERALPGAVTSPLKAVRSVQKLRAVAEREDALVVAGHDPNQWAGLKRAPSAY